MACMVDTDQTVYSCGCSGSELPRMKFALILGYGRQRVAHVADPRLLQIDDLNSGDRRKNLDYTFGHASHARMLVQSNPLVDRTNEVRAKKLDPRRDVGNDVAEGKSSLGTRHDDLAELDVASRAPRKHARSPGARESGHRIATDSPGCLCVAGTVLNNTAAICRTAED